MARFGAHPEGLDEPEAAHWRVIGTDTERITGVAPVCPKPDVHAMMHGGPPDDVEVYDECCVHGPHLECWGEGTAVRLRDFLNEYGVEVCS